MSQSFPNNIDNEEHIKPPSVFESATTTMSKNQMKRMARQQRMLDLRPERRRIEKERRKQKRLEQAKLRETLPQVTQQTKRTLMAESDNKFRVVIDMDFENLMTDKEIAKAAKQVSRVYAINKRSQSPCQLYISSVKGKIRNRFDVTCTGYNKWDINISEKNYLDMLIDELKSSSGESQDSDKVKDRIVYLTGDTEENLPDTEEILKDNNKIFVIGGLVDHNRHRNLCFTRAQERGIKTARLPIKDYIQLCQRHILSTVTVFEIMLNVLGHCDTWLDAFLKSIPKRKIKQQESIVDKTTNLEQEHIDTIDVK